MPFRIPEHLVIKETGHWIINHRVDTKLPGYLMVGSRHETANLFDLPAPALAELGPLLAACEKSITDLWQTDHLYIGRYGHTAGHSIHLHVIPIYAWVKAAFAADSRYRMLRSFYTPGVSTSDPDGGELTLFVWRELGESATPPPIRGPSVDEAVRLLRGKFRET